MPIRRVKSIVRLRSLFYNLPGVAAAIFLYIDSLTANLLLIGLNKYFINNAISQANLSKNKIF